MTITYRRVKALLSESEDHQNTGIGYQRQTSIKPKQTISYDFITLDAYGMLTIMQGYAWDFASGAFDNKTIRRGSLAHDALCELIHNDLLSYHFWGPAAEEMKAICLEDGMNRVRAWYICRAIKLAGPDITAARRYITE
jgi:hypothetical protein